MAWSGRKERDGWSKMAIGAAGGKTMGIINRLLLISSFVLLPGLVGTGQAAEKAVWGENVGFVYARVAKQNHPKGLVVATAPRKEGKVLAYMRKGTPIRGYSVFQNGWVKLKEPFGKGWLNMRYLKSAEVAGTVSKVATDEGCLTVRNGPGLSFKKLGCLSLGETVKLTGIGASSKWLFIENPTKGWVRPANVDVKWPLASARQDRTVSAVRNGPSGRRAARSRNSAWDDLPEVRIHGEIFNEDRWVDRQIEESWADTDRLLNGL
jgi:hypothetical protein